MMKRIYIYLVIISAVLLFGCEKPSGQEGGETLRPEPEEMEEFIILSWSDIINADAEWKLEKMKEAGFNAYLGWFDTFAEVDAILTSADKLGMKIITSCPELETDKKNIVEAMSAHPSLYGYHIEDEPEVSEFSMLEGRIKGIRAYDQERPCYVNVYPNWAWGGEDAYLPKLRSFLKSVSVSFLSFDNYPIKMVGGERQVRGDWYHNLEDIRVAAKEAKMPFWGFALALAHNTNEASYPIPTIADLRLQQFSNLVYGAVAFQYFTTWGIIQNGGVTGVYADVKRVNGELKQLEKIFLGADIKNVWHTGKVIPSGTKKLNAYPSGITKITTGDEGAVVSYFTNNGKKYMAFVNKSCIGGLDVSITFSAKAARVAKDGAESPVEDSYRIPAGDIIIFTWE